MNLVRRSSSSPATIFGMRVPVITTIAVDVRAGGMRVGLRRIRRANRAAKA